MNKMKTVKIMHPTTSTLEELSQWYIERELSINVLKTLSKGDLTRWSLDCKKNMHSAKSILKALSIWYIGRELSKNVLDTLSKGDIYKVKISIVKKYAPSNIDVESLFTLSQCYFEREHSDIQCIHLRCCKCHFVLSNILYVTIDIISEYQWHIESVSSFGLFVTQ